MEVVVACEECGLAVAKAEAVALIGAWWDDGWDGGGPVARRAWKAAWAGLVLPPLPACT